MSVITHDWRPAFIAALSESVSVMDAAKAAGIGHVTAYKERKRDPEFAALWATVREAKFYERRACERCGEPFKWSRTSGKAGRFCSDTCKFARQREEGEARSAARFWEKVNTDGPTSSRDPELRSCWVWTAAVDGMGYGMYRHTRAHRFSWELAAGPIPDGLCVLHRCDTPPCVRPSHLFLGTRDDNMRDRQAKQRQARGERAGRAILTAEQVAQARALRDAGAQVRELAERFGVAEATMSHACTGRSWGHVA